MTNTSLVIVGGGGFGRETVDVVRAMNRANQAAYASIGIADDSLSSDNMSRLDKLHVPFLGSIASLSASPGSTDFVVAVADGSTRRRLASLISALGYSRATLIHPSAQIGSCVKICPGSVICANVSVSSLTILGNHVHLGANSTVGHDCEIGDFSSVNPGAVVSGNVTVGEGVLVGAGATVLQGLSVGTGSVVAAAACVVRTVEAGAVVKGVPAR